MAFENGVMIQKPLSPLQVINHGEEVQPEVEPSKYV